MQMALDILESLIQHGTSDEEGHDPFSILFSQCVTSDTLFDKNAQWVENEKEIAECRRHLGEDGRVALQKLRETVQQETEMKVSYDELRTRLGFDQRGHPQSQSVACDDEDDMRGEDVGVGWV